MKIKKGDNVIVITGKDKGKTGTVTEAFPKEDRVLVEGDPLLRQPLGSEDVPGAVIRVFALGGYIDLHFTCLHVVTFSFAGAGRRIGLFGVLGVLRRRARCLVPPVRGVPHKLLP